MTFQDKLQEIKLPEEQWAKVALFAGIIFIIGYIVPFFRILMVGYASFCLAKVIEKHIKFEGKKK